MADKIIQTYYFVEEKSQIIPNPNPNGLIAFSVVHIPSLYSSKGEAQKSRVKLIERECNYRHLVPANEVFLTPKEAWENYLDGKNKEISRLNEQILKFQDQAILAINALKKLEE